MTIRYCGPGGNDGNSGLTWALRKLSLNGVEDTPVVAGDIVYVGPGVYREALTVDVSGGSIYTTGTVSVTNGSTTVTGAGTAFVANIAIADLFHVATFAAGNDGVANGTATFTSAAGNFQAGMIGKAILISGRYSYIVAAVAAANSITLSDPNGSGWPGAGIGLTYTIMSGEGPYEIASITDNTNLELVRPWCAPSLTGLAYIAYMPIRYIGDVSGENTDGIGGIVRITGSDNDQTAVRDKVINVRWFSYRMFRGFVLDMSTDTLISTYEPNYITVEDCFLTSDTNAAISFWRDQTGNTVRRCVFLIVQVGIYFGHPVGWFNSTGLVENCLVVGAHTPGVNGDQVGAITIKDSAFLGCTHRGGYCLNLPAGSAGFFHNNIFAGISSGYALSASWLSEVLEDYNTFWRNGTDRQNVGVGPGSVSYPPLFQPPLLLYGYKYPWWFSELSEWSQIVQMTGLQAACRDMRGIERPTSASKKSWGPLQFTDMERDTGTAYAGAASMEIGDAGRIQFKVPCTTRSYMVRVRVQREANYAGTNPQIVIKQPGQVDRTTADTGAAAAWNLLEDTFIPAADPEYFFVELVSNNTAVAGNYATYFDNLEVRGEPQQPGEFEHWMWNRQPFETLPANALVVHGREYQRRRVPGEVSVLAEYE